MPTLFFLIAILVTAGAAGAQLYPSAWTRLTDDRTWNRHASWSPDQQSIAFVKNSDVGMQLVVIDSDGSNRQG